MPTLLYSNDGDCVILLCTEPQNDEVKSDSENLRNDNQRPKFAPNSPTEDELNKSPYYGPQALQEVEVHNDKNRKYRLFRYLEHIYRHDGSSSPCGTLNPFLPSKGTKTAVVFNSASDCNGFAEEFAQKRWPICTFYKNGSSSFGNSETVADFRNGNTDILFTTASTAVDSKIADADYIIFYDYPGYVEKYVLILHNLADYAKVKSGNIIVVLTLLTVKTPKVRAFVDFLKQGDNDVDENVSNLARFGRIANLTLENEPNVALAEVIYPTKSVYSSMSVPPPPTPVYED